MQLHIIPRWFPYLAIAIYPFILVRKGRRLSISMENHERIHFAQQIELFIILFFVWYVVEFLIRFIAYRFDWARAYENISFEREAYDKQYNHAYRAWRKPFAFLKYM